MKKNLVRPERRLRTGTWNDSQSYHAHPKIHTKNHQYHFLHFPLMSDGKLELIDLDIPELGYTQFISSWLYNGPMGSFLIDPGPACTIPVLVAALRARGIKKLDYILLTHIHMDHAGGTALLLDEFPEAKVVCHEKGKRHLIDPKRLWEGSRAVIGHVAEVYGEILPVDEKNIIATESLPFGTGINIISTPGHASHHQCLAFDNYLFVGELLGTYVHIEDELYLRPATPHRFVLEDYLSSMDLLMDHLRPTICFAHHGSHAEPKMILRKAKAQLQLWVSVIDEHRGSKETEDIVKVLLLEDPLLNGLAKLSPVLQRRELHFTENSVCGIIKYLDS